MVKVDYPSGLASSSLPMFLVLIMIGLVLIAPTASADVTNAPVRVFVIGDSTVLNFGSIVGWGQEIYRYFDHGVLVRDDAFPGESAKTFITHGRWAGVLNQLSTNDYVLIQFGHNDSHNPIYREATIANGDYKTYLQEYIDGSRAKGAIPVFVTPMHRRNFDTNGTLLSYIVDTKGYRDDLAPYVAAMKQVAASNHVPCVDLFASSGVYMQQLGNGLVYSSLMFHGDGGSTHFNRKGASIMAALVARGLSEVLPRPSTLANSCDLAQHLRIRIIRSQLPVDEPSLNKYEPPSP